MMCVMRLKIVPYFRARRRPQRFAQLSFIVVFLHITPNGLSERGNTRCLDSSKGEVFHVLHVWK